MLGRWNPRRYQWGVQPAVLRIAASMRARSFKVWVDTEMMSGSTLDAMAAAVENAHCILICVTERYKASANCRLEGTYVHEQRKPWVPLMLEASYKPTGWLGIMCVCRPPPVTPRLCARARKGMALNRLRGGTVTLVQAWLAALLRVHGRGAERRRGVGAPRGQRGGGGAAARGAGAEQPAPKAAAAAVVAGSEAVSKVVAPPAKIVAAAWCADGRGRHVSSVVRTTIRNHSTNASNNNIRSATNDQQHQQLQLRQPPHAPRFYVINRRAACMATRR